METFINILLVFGLGALGALLYALVSVWKIVQNEGFSGKKFFNDNKYFWLVCLALNLVFAIVIMVVPEFTEVLHTLGFAVEATNKGGYVLLGIALATGSDKTKITGNKTLKKPPN